MRTTALPSIASNGLTRPQLARKRVLDNPEKWRNFISKRVSISESGCWNWRNRKHRFGYGVVQIAVRMETDPPNGRAHRVLLTASVVSYVAFKSDLALGLSILHSCDNPPCCNPDHLSAGTHEENMRQAFERQRFPDRKLDVSKTLAMRLKHRERQRRYLERKKSVAMKGANP